MTTIQCLGAKAHRFPVGAVTLLLVVLFAFFFQRPETIVVGSILCAIYAMSIGSPSYVRCDLVVVICLISLLCIPSLLSLNHGFSPMFYYFSTVMVLFAARRLSMHSLGELLLAFRVAFAISSACIFAALFVYWDFPEPFGEILEGSSTNGIPSYLIILQIGLSLTSYLATGRLPLVSSITTLVVAYFGLGRASLVVAGIIVTVSIFVNISRKDLFVGAKFIFLSIFVMLILSVLSLYWDELLFLLFEKTKLKEGLFDVYRFEMLEQYLNKLNAWSLLFGADYSGTVIYSQYAGNPHISFIRTHAYFGFVGLLVSIFSPLLIVFSSKRRRDKFVFFILISVAVIRASTEPVLFPTLLDFYYCYYFFVFFRHAAPKKTLIKLGYGCAERR